MPTKKSEAPAKIAIDMDKCLRLSNKIMNLLQKKSKKIAETYFAIRLVGIFLEEKYGIKITPDQEEELRKSIRKEGESMAEESSAKESSADIRA